jgi:hypothetical protein
MNVVSYATSKTGTTDAVPAMAVCHPCDRKKSQGWGTEFWGTTIMEALESRASRPSKRSHLPEGLTQSRSRRGSGTRKRRANEVEQSDLF